ncbi:hypothetical protein AHAS_Ahas02G0064800 [Arachis hypogaea]
MSTNEYDVKNYFDNDLGDDFDYEPNAQDDTEDDDVDSLDSTSKSEQDCVTDKVQVKNLHNFGANTCHIMGYIAFQKGGYRHAGFTRKALYNHIDRYRRSKADGESIVDYHYFGDIVAFDSTYKKNKYNKPLVIFFGCNHHGQTVIFDSGLLSDKTTDTYKWLLETFVEAMGGKSPKAVITGGDLAMRNAIKNVLPAVIHQLCG